MLYFNKLKFLMPLLLALSLNVHADVSVEIEVPSSFNPVGSGARAIGMGGAFISIADDATAASWNPSGLMSLKDPEFSIVGNWQQRDEDNTFTSHPESNHTGTVIGNRLNYLSASYPFRAFEHDMIVSLNYQNLFEFDRKWDFQLDTGNDSSRRQAYEQNGALYALGLAFAANINPDISVGATANIWGDFLEKNRWQQHETSYISRVLGGNMLYNITDASEQYDFSGVNFNLGLTWRISENLTLGAVLKTPFDADIDRTTTYSSTTYFLDDPDVIEYQPQSTTYSDQTLRMPMSYGLGLSYRHLKQISADDTYRTEWKVAIDLYRTEWSRFAMIGSDGITRSALSGRPISEAGKPDDTLWVRLGGEFLIRKDPFVIPLRAGLFYDPAPADGGSDPFYGFSLGSGIGNNQFVFDLAYQYRIGKDVGGDALSHLGFSQDVTEHRLYGSFIMHF